MVFLLVFVELGFEMNGFFNFLRKKIFIIKLKRNFLFSGSEYRKF